MGIGRGGRLRYVVIEGGCGYADVGGELVKFGEEGADGAGGSGLVWSGGQRNDGLCEA